MSKVFRSLKSLTLLGGLVLSLLLIVTYLSVRAQQNADHEIEIQLEKAAAPTNLGVDLPAYIAHRQTVLREQAAANPSKKVKAMVFFSDTKGSDAFLAMLNETEIPLHALGGIYRIWEEFKGGFDVNEESLQDFNIQSKATLVELIAKQHRDHSAFMIQDTEKVIGQIADSGLKPEDRERVQQQYQQFLGRLKAYDVAISQHGPQFCSFQVERELQQLVQIQNRNDVAMVDVSLPQEKGERRLNAFALATKGR